MLVIHEEYLSTRKYTIHPWMTWRAVCRPLYPFCEFQVSCNQDDPTEPWIGTCKRGHTAIYELDKEDDNL